MDPGTPAALGRTVMTLSVNGDRHDLPPHNSRRVRHRR